MVGPAKPPRVGDGATFGHSGRVSDTCDVLRPRIQRGATATPRGGDSAARARDRQPRLLAPPGQPPDTQNLRRGPQAIPRCLEIDYRATGHGISCAIVFDHARIHMGVTDSHRAWPGVRLEHLTGASLVRRHFGCAAEPMDSALLRRTFACRASA